jgi:hypothetical protein
MKTNRYRSIFPVDTPALGSVVTKGKANANSASHSHFGYAQCKPSTIHHPPFTIHHPLKTSNYVLMQDVSNPKYIITVDYGSIVRRIAIFW